MIGSRSAVPASPAECLPVGDKLWDFGLPAGLSWPPKACHQVDAERLYAGTALSAVTAIIFATTNTRLTGVRPGAWETTHTARRDLDLDRLTCEAS